MMRRLKYDYNEKREPFKPKRYVFILNYDEVYPDGQDGTYASRDDGIEDPILDVEAVEDRIIPLRELDG
jgi:hypothetical protein